MVRELRAKCNSGLTVTSFDREGIIFNSDNRNYYFSNETAAFLLDSLKERDKGLSFSMLRSLLLGKYQIYDEKQLDNDLESFLQDLNQHGIVELHYINADNENIKLNNFHNESRGIYVKPIINGELRNMSIGSQVLQIITDVSTVSVASGLLQPVSTTKK